MSLLHYLMQQAVRHRVLRYFHRHGPLERHVTHDIITRQASDRDPSSIIYASAISNRASRRLHARSACAS